MATDITFVQIALLTLLAILGGIDPYIGGWQLSRPAISGFLAGLIMGDMVTGLVVGASLQLLVLGVGTFGGASIPDMGTGAIIGTTLAVTSGMDIETAVGVSVPVGLLLVQLDILARFSNVFFIHRIDKHIDNGEFVKANREAWYGLFPIALSRGLPVFISLAFGNQFIEKLITIAPEWLMGGLKLAGAILPVVGIAILLRYLPVKKFIPYLIIGYILAAYLAMPMMGIALVGLAVSLIYYKQIQEKRNVAHIVGNTAYAREGEINDDEC